MKKNKGHIKLICEGLLLLTFIICTLFVVLIGSGVLDSITKRSDDNFERLITRQYIINKVHESDKAGLISTVELEGEQVLKIDIPDSEYSSYIYYYDGGIRELVANINDGLGLSDGIKILDCKEFEIKALNGCILIDNIKVNLRSNKGYGIK